MLSQKDSTRKSLFPITGDRVPALIIAKKFNIRRGIYVFCVLCTLTKTRISCPLSAVGRLLRASAAFSRPRRNFAS